MTMPAQNDNVRLLSFRTVQIARDMLRHQIALPTIAKALGATPLDVDISLWTYLGRRPS